MSGNVLRLVSTPIGNLADISGRALEYLKECQIIVAEDTRNTLSLLKLLDIETKNIRLISFHEHNQQAAETLARELMDYQRVALVSDAGSPVLSDPGYPLVNEFLKLGGELESLPGPSAVTCALEVSGLAPLPFSFYGFFPRKKEARATFIKSCGPGVTHIGFESPGRVEGLLSEISKVHPQAEVAAARELTKLYEQVYRFQAKSWPEVEKEFKAKGEFVVMFRYEGEKRNESNEELEKMADNYLQKPSPKALARLIASVKGVKAQEVYDQLSSLKAKK